jgi:hypothetical protein
VGSHRPKELNTIREISCRVYNERKKLWSKNIDNNEKCLNIQVKNKIVRIFLILLFLQVF